MIGLDTNVLLRALLNDDPAQSQAAKAALAANCNIDNPCLVDPIVIVEAVWVLRSLYKYSRADIVAFLEALIRTVEFDLLDHVTVLFAMTAYRNSKADFADCLIAARNRAAGCVTTLTFDRDAGATAGFTLVG